MNSNCDWTLVLCWCWLGVRYLCVASWCIRRYIWYISCPARNSWRRFIWRYLRRISWVIVITRCWSIWNWVSWWVNWNDLTNLVVNNGNFLISIPWSCCLTFISLLFSNVAINYWGISISVLMTISIPSTRFTRLSKYKRVISIVI